MNVWPKVPAASCAVWCFEKLSLVSYPGETISIVATRNGTRSELLLHSQQLHVAIIPTCAFVSGCLMNYNYR